MPRRTPTSTLFPYTTLFRSSREPVVDEVHHALILLRADNAPRGLHDLDRKSTRLNSSHANTSYAVSCLKKKNASSRQAALHRSTAECHAGARPSRCRAYRGT